MEPGIYPGMKRADYDAIHSMNISQLVHGIRSMAHLKYRMDHPEDVASDALVFGQAVHFAVFEPETLEQNVVALDVNRRTNAGKTEIAAHEAAGKLVLRPDDWSHVIGIRDSVHRHKECRELLQGPGKGELSFTGTLDGVVCKGRLDRFCSWNGWSVALDLKSCLDARPWAFSAAVHKFHYAIKAAWYLDLLNSIAPSERRFFWIAIEKEAPYAVALYEPADQALAEGRRVYKGLLAQYSACLASGEWPSYPGGIEPLDLPAYAYKGGTGYVYGSS